jgi:hypothetical protein
MGKGQGSGPLFDDFEGRVRLSLESGIPQELVILVIPSHDEDNKRIPDQDAWAEAAIMLLADLYRGATAFKALSGIFKTDDGTILRDEPILLESYASRDDVLDAVKLRSLHDFAVRMGKETKQNTVAIVIGNFMHLIPMKRR